MLETSGICMLKIVEYESMSGEHVWVNWEMIFTSVISGVLSLEAPKN